MAQSGQPGWVAVAGAAGKTGRAVCAALLARGVPVRALVRPGSGSAVVAGVEPVGVDLLTGVGLREALTGTRALYHLAPNVHPGEVAMARQVGAAARAVGLRRLVFHSVLRPDDERMPHHLRKAQAEALLRQVALPELVVLRPGAYHQNLLGAALAGELAVPYRLDVPFTTVDLADVAEVAASALLGRLPAGSVVDLAGPESLTVAQLAAQAEQVLGRSVTARRLTLAEWSAGPGSGLAASARADLLAMFAAYDEDGLAGDGAALAALLGRTPRSWARMLAEQPR